LLVSCLVRARQPVTIDRREKTRSCSVLASDRSVGKDVPNGQTTMEPLSYSDSEGVKNGRTTAIGAGG
jgi:hypothetical protein